jgi:hypothetical protein
LYELKGGEGIERGDDRFHPVAQQASETFRRQKGRPMVVQESQHVKLTEGFYANALKPTVDVGVGDVFLSHDCEPFSAAAAKHTKR